MNKITILIIALAFSSVITGCANFQNTTSPSSQNSYATVSTNTSGSSSLTTTSSPAITNSSISTASNPSTTSTTSGSTNNVGTTSSQPVTLNGLAKKWDASIGQFEKTYYYSDKFTDLSIKIISIQTVHKKDIGGTDTFLDGIMKLIDDSLLEIEIVTGNGGISSVLDFKFLDNDGNQFEEKPFLRMSPSSIVFLTDSNSNLASHIKFMVMKGLDAKKNNGITNIIFEVLK